MTLQEYRLRMRGYVIGYLDQEYLVHLQAMANRKAIVSNDKGEYIYKDMSSFYDREKRRQELLGFRHQIGNKNLLRIAKNLKEYREKGEKCQ